MGTAEGACGIGRGWPRGFHRMERVGAPGRRAGGDHGRGAGMVDRGLRAGACRTGRVGGAQENSSRRSEKTRGPTVRPPLPRGTPTPHTPFRGAAPDVAHGRTETQKPCSTPDWRSAEPTRAPGIRTGRAGVLFNCSPCSNFSSIAIRSFRRDARTLPSHGCSGLMRNLLPTFPLTLGAPCTTPWNRRGNPRRPLPLTLHEPALGGAHAERRTRDANRRDVQPAIPVRRGPRPRSAGR